MSSLMLVYCSNCYPSDSGYVSSAPTSKAIVTYPVMKNPKTPIAENVSARLRTFI